LLWNGTCSNQSATYSPLFPTRCTKAGELAQKTGASTWLTTLPIAEHGFVLHKGAFHDAICLRNRWRPPLQPSQCVCGRKFTAEHALSCHYDGGLPTTHHNEVRNIKAHLMSDVCHNVAIVLNQSCNPSARGYTTAALPTQKMGDALTLRHRGSLKMIDSVHFLMLGCAHTYHSLPPSTCYRRHEQEKKGAYDQYFREVEHGCFLLLILSASGGGPTAKMAYKKLASVVATKHNQSYSQQLTSSGAGLASPYFAPQLCA